MISPRATRVVSPTNKLRPESVVTLVAPTPPLRSAVAKTENFSSPLFSFFLPPIFKSKFEKKNSVLLILDRLETNILSFL